jgi:hypothetical protein
MRCNTGSTNLTSGTEEMDGARLETRVQNELKGKGNVRIKN